MGFQEKFEKNLNQELEEDHPESPPPPPIDIEGQQPPPPINTFTSYPSPPPSRRSGMYIPIPLFILFVLVFFFESSVIFVYTVVALFNTLPPAMMPISTQSTGCNCLGSGLDRLPINVAPNIYIPSQAAIAAADTHAVTITVTASSSTPPSSALSASDSTTSTPISSSTTSTSATSPDKSVGISNIIGAFTTTHSSDAPTLQTVTAPIPTITVLSTASASQSVLTMTVLSTTDASPTPHQATVTSVAVGSRR